MIVHTKLWVDIQQGKDEGEFLIHLLSKKSYETDNVVEQEWSQHRHSHLWVSGKATDSLISSISTSNSNFNNFRKIIRTVLSSPEKLVYQIDVSESIEGW